MVLSLSLFVRIGRPRGDYRYFRGPVFGVIRHRRPLGIKVCRAQPDNHDDCGSKENDAEEAEEGRGFCVHRSEVLLIKGIGY